jgi:hypothetical protein
MYKVYLLRIKSNKLEYPVFKIGVSSDVRKRITSLSSTNKPSSKVKNLGIKNCIELLHSSEDLPYDIVGKVESRLHSLHSSNRYIGNPLLPNGNTELFININLLKFKLDLITITRELI